MLKHLIVIMLCSSLMAQGIDFQTAWKDLLNKNPGIKATETALQSSQKIKEANNALYYPEISLNGSYTHLSDPTTLDISEGLNTVIADVNYFIGSLHPGSGKIPPVSSDRGSFDLTEKDVFLAGLSLLWPLYTGGRIDALGEIRDAQVDEEKAKLQMRKDASFILLVKFYYGVILSSSLLDTRVEMEKAFYQHYEHTKKMKEQGQIAKVELLNAKVQLDNARIERIKAEHGYEIALSALQKLLHDPDAIPINDLFINADIEEEVSYSHRSQENFPALAILDAKTSQSESFVKIENAHYMPTVAAYGNVNLYKDNSVISDTIPDWHIGLAVKFNIISRSGRSEKVEAARLVNIQLKMLKQQARDDLAIMVDKTYKEMQQYLDEFEALNSTLELAIENVRLRELAYTEGLSTSLEAIDAQMLLKGAKTKRLDAAYNYIQKLSQLLVLAGERDKFLTLAQNAPKVEK